MKEQIMKRIKIWENNHVISHNVGNNTIKVLDEVIASLNDLDEEKISMFITHFAMAAQRTETGNIEQSMDKEVWETVKVDESYSMAERFLQQLLKDLNIKFPDSEKEFLLLHLCNVLHKE